MKINRYINFITEEAPFNFEVSTNISNRPSDEWTSIELEDLRSLGADNISKNTAIFKQGSFNVTIQKNKKSPIYIATSDVPINIKGYKNNITKNFWNDFIKKLEDFIKKNGDISIEIICNKYKIKKKNWTLNKDGTVDVDGGVNLSYKNLDKIPINFGNVTGVFWCHGNNITNLIGSPKRVGGWFNCCYNNNLTSLEGCSTYIGIFDCQNNPNLWSMDHFPRHAKAVDLYGTPINIVYYLFSTVYLADGGEYFTTSGSMMDFFWDCDPVWPDKIIKKRRMNNFLYSIDKELTNRDIKSLNNRGWKVED